MMTLHGVRSRTGRVPRFLVHPGLLKFPFFFNLFRRLGGLLACREHMDHVLARGGVLGVFPEGVEGAFRLYRDAYRIDRFRRNAFVRAAIRHRAVIVPFVTAGSAEASPILAKIEWDWWRKRTLWPAFPITPTLLPLPIPLPSKWRTRFLPPVDPGTRDDSASVRRVSGDIRTQMQAALTELAAARRSPRQA
jgi:1-acyl-sn-glycerol-3-phosphate acyltransferase